MGVVSGGGGKPIGGGWVGAGQYSASPYVSLILAMAACKLLL